MATRGTYKVNGTLLYNHWDNYPSGTAYQLIKTIEKCNNLELFSVIRGMERIEPTNSIFDGRAEYYYEIDNYNKKISCYSIPYDKDTIVLISSNSFENWLNDNIKNNLESNDNPEDYTIIKLRDNYYCTLTQVREQIKFKYEQAKTMTDAGYIGNASSTFSDLFKLINKSGLNFDDIKKEYLETYAPMFVKSYGHETPDYFNSYVNNI
jgi:hypothetical protein